MPCGRAAGQQQSGRGIYLVDNKQGGIECAELMYTVPNLKYCGFFKRYFLISRKLCPFTRKSGARMGPGKLLWGRLLIGGLTKHK
jgi:hypothetical protein